jgi:hypothetical protein
VSPKDAAMMAALEAPAVPLNPADEEFVSGHLTEAEVFEKYGLHAEAMAQLKAVTERFPGHVAASDKLVGYLRTTGDRPALRTGLLTLAFARRASGDVEGAKRAVSEAAKSGAFEPGMQCGARALRPRRRGSGRAGPSRAGAFAEDRSSRRGEASGFPRRRPRGPHPPRGRGGARDPLRRRGRTRPPPRSRPTPSRTSGRRSSSTSGRG